jgi:MoxR-like ATPase
VKAPDLFATDASPACARPREAVVLSRMTEEEKSEAAAWLGARGYRIVSSARVANLALVGEGVAKNELRQISAVTGKAMTLRELKASRPSESADIAVTAPPVREPDPEPLFVEDRDSVTLAGFVLPKNRNPSPLVPPAAQFAHLVIDQPLAETMRAIAVGVVHGRPVALEGETAAAKTTAVLYLAHLMRQGVRRLNLNGATDAGELVGRFAPAPAGGFRFVESVLPQAMRHGEWVLLDEINLAEPQCIERLNPVLEQPPTLILSENDGTVFGGHGGVAVHESFRVIATYNPAAYTGRNALSPALRSRFHVHCAKAPGLQQDLDLLRRLVHGTQPVVTLAGRRWQADQAQPVHPALAQWPYSETFLAALAKFHNHVAKAAGQGGGEASLGRDRSERYCFNRRSLLFLVAMLDRALRAGTDPDTALRTALGDVYLGQLDDASDERAVIRMAEACGLIRQWKDAA